MKGAKCRALRKALFTKEEYHNKGKRVYTKGDNGQITLPDNFRYYRFLKSAVKGQSFDTKQPMNLLQAPAMR